VSQKQNLCMKSKDFSRREHGATQYTTSSAKVNPTKSPPPSKPAARSVCRPSTLPYIIELVEIRNLFRSGVISKEVAQSQAHDKSFVTG